MSRNFIKLLFASLVGALLGSFLTLYSENQNEALIYSATYSPSPVYSSLGQWEKITNRASPNLVSIQVFQKDRLVRQSSGLIASSDGFVIAPADIVVTDAIYQVFYEDKIYKAKIAQKDYKLNLLLLKTEAQYSNIIELENLENYQAGREILMLGKITDFSKSTPVSQRGIISSVTEKTVIIDAASYNYVLGMVVLNSDGKFIGLSYSRNGRIIMIRAGSIKVFLKDYLSKNNQ